MYSLVIRKSIPLRGSVRICSAKNAVLPLMAAALLTNEEVVIQDVPRLEDVLVMCAVLNTFGVSTKAVGGKLIIRADSITGTEAVGPVIKKLRASSLVLGPLAARTGSARMSEPGGCSIGKRPLDIHIMGFEALGAKVATGGGIIEISAQGRLRGAEIEFAYPSVGATENIVMAATLAEGRTVIKNAASEPEIRDLCDMLRKMGAEIYGDGTDTITVYGKERLHGAVHTPIPDRIEAGTIMIAAAATGGDVWLYNVVWKHLVPVTRKLCEAGAKVIYQNGAIRVIGPPDINAFCVSSNPHPGFPTDLQAQIMTLGCIAKGTSVIEETVFENRFQHVGELRRMGADIDVSGKQAIISGVDRLVGSEVRATDLRAGAAVVIAGLVASGQTVISDVYNIDRGYEALDMKLNSLGANIERLTFN